MKRFMELTVQFKFIWAIMFTAAIILYSVVALLQGKTSMDFILIWEFVVITMVISFIHMLIYGEFILTSLSMKVRVIIHFLLCYITSFVWVYILKWIDISKIETVLIFTAAYTAIYISMNFSLYMYYKGTGEQLNDRLAAYKQNKKFKEAGK
jgi:hypothetical protein